MPHNLNFPAGALAVMVSQISASPCLVQGASPEVELRETLYVTVMQRRGQRGQEELKKMTHLRCEHVILKIGPSR